jgi:hypothetical protein
MFRLFGITPLRRWFLYVLITETIVVNLMTCITIFVQCGKVESLWDPVGTPSKCWPPAAQAVSPDFVEIAPCLELCWFWARILDTSKEVRTFTSDNQHAFAKRPVAANSATDLVLTCLPSSIFFTLQMKPRIKLGLAVLLGLSILWVQQWFSTYSQPG